VKGKAYRMLVESQKERNHLQDQDIGGWIILKLIFERQDVMIWTGLLRLRMGLVERSCEHGNEPLDSIKFWEFLE
jgi:hypothetical protein